MCAECGGGDCGCDDSDTLEGDVSIDASSLEVPSNLMMVASGILDPKQLDDLLLMPPHSDEDYGVTSDITSMTSSSVTSSAAVTTSSAAAPAAVSGQLVGSLSAAVVVFNFF